MKDLHMDVLDFMDIEKRCRTNLTDGELVGVLVCIDAQRALKTLKLTHCFGITGLGLEPLRGSVVLERVDLCLVEQYESPVITPDPAISVDVVVPILDSIIEQEASLLRHIQLPKKWRDEKKDVLSQFLVRYDRFLSGQGIICSNEYEVDEKCQNVCQGTEQNPWVDRGRCGCPENNDQNNQWTHDHTCYNHDYGVQGFTCYQCMRHVCGECNEGGTFYMIDICQYCEKKYCEHCNEVVFCQGGKCCTGTHRQTTSCQSCNKLNQW